MGLWRGARGISLTVPELELNEFMELAESYSGGTPLPLGGSLGKLIQHLLLKPIRAYPRFFFEEAGEVG
jgi:hypothetical protein